MTFTDVPKNKSALPGGVSRIISPDDFQQAITVSVSKLRKQFITRATEANPDLKAKKAGEKFDVYVADLVSEADPSELIGWKDGARKELDSKKV